jgi:hypothetical protein
MLDSQAETSRSSTAPSRRSSRGPGPDSGAKLLAYKLKCPKASVSPGNFTDQFGDQFGAGTFIPGSAKTLVPAE